MLTKDGVKLLDFGLAKRQTRAIDPALSALPTQDQPLTREGSIVGTLHYMSPEQLEGKEVDIRADLFSLGAVLYEMVTGRKAFDGDSPAKIITAIMSATPPSMAELKPVTPPSLERLVTSCLVKDRDSRWQGAGILHASFPGLPKRRKSRPRDPLPSSRGRWRAFWPLLPSLSWLTYSSVRARRRSSCASRFRRQKAGASGLYALERVRPCHPTARGSLLWSSAKETFGSRCALSMRKAPSCLP